MWKLHPLPPHPPPSEKVTTHFPSNPPLKVEVQLEVRSPPQQSRGEGRLHTMWPCFKFSPHITLPEYTCCTTMVWYTLLGVRNDIKSLSGTILQNFQLWEKWWNKNYIHPTPTITINMENEKDKNYYISSSGNEKLYWYNFKIQITQYPLLL